MHAEKGPAKTPARSKAGGKRRKVPSGSHLFAVLAGLALAVTLAVLAMVLFGPFPPLPSGPGVAAVKGAQLRPHVVSSTAARSARKAKAAQEPSSGHPVHPTPAQASPLPFEEHLPATASSNAAASEVRGKVEAPAPAAPPTAPEPETFPPSAVDDTGKGPRMVVVIDDIGDNPAMARALMELPFPVTLAILPDRPWTRAVEAQAVQHGIEVILHQPMQPISYPRVNPGPGALFTDMDGQRVKATVTANIAQLPHIVGINNHMGSAFTSDAAGMEAVMSVLKAKGLFFMDSVTSPTSAAPEAARKAGVPFYRRAVFLDNVRNTRAILGQLKTAERHALKHGRAVAIGHPYSETYEALKIWAKERDGRVALITLTQLGPEF